GIADGNNEIDHQQIRDAENALVRLLDMNRYPFRGKAEGSDGQMEQDRSVGQTVGEMRLIPPKSVRAHHRSPLAATVTQHDDDRRRQMPIGLGFVESQ